MKRTIENWSRRAYIENFCDDLNYQKIILYIGNVNKKKLLDRLEKDYINHLNRFDYILNSDNPHIKDFMFIENCDLQDVGCYVWGVLDYVIEEDYTVATLQQDGDDYYISDVLY